MTNATYRAGIVGLGFIGGADQVSGDALGQRVVDLDGTHFDALSSHPRVNIVAGSSRDAGRRERFVQRTEAAVYADWKEMLAKEALDVVSVATYAPVHAEITVACAEQGIRAIYCEKPIATRLPDAEQMVAACDKTGALLVLNHQRRFNLNHRRLRDLIAGGGLGKLTSGLLQWGSGRLGNVGTHMIDALLMLTGRRIEAVSATLDLAGKPDCRGPAFRDPGGWGVIKLEGGIMVMVDAGDYATVPGRIILNGAEGRAISDGSSVTLEYWDGRGEGWDSTSDGVSGMDRAVMDLIAGDGLGELTSGLLQWGSGRLGNVGTHMIDALLMLTGRKIEAVSATLDLAGKPDCRGPAFRDPGGWGVIKLEGGIMVMVDAGDYATVPGRIILNGTEGRAISDGSSVTLEYWDGRAEGWDSTSDGASGMDRAVMEIVVWLDDGAEFPYPASEAVNTLEAIVGFHASHARNAAWTELPLSGADREREVLCG